MELKLLRQPSSDLSTQGEIVLDGRHLYFTLEPKNPIPEGRYKVILQWSPKHDYFVPGLVDVPGHTEIEIHIGNMVQNTLGCILVGLSRSPDWVGQSTEAFLKLMLKYLVPAFYIRKEEIWIDIRRVANEPS